MEDRWLSVEEIAAHLGVRRDTVYRWVNERNLPAHKIGRIWKFNRGEVDAWVRSDVATDSNSINSEQKKSITRDRGDNGQA